METKIIEIRDRATLIPVLAINLNPTLPGRTGVLVDLDSVEVHAAELWHLRRFGYPCDHRPNIGITHLIAKETFCNDPYSWNDRTYQTAHLYIIEHWDDLRSGDVVDVEFILGETSVPKQSERFDNADMIGSR